MKAINRAGNLKRITTHPNRKYRQDAAKAMVKRTPQQQLAHLDKCGYTAKRERAKLKEV